MPATTGRFAEANQRIQTLVLTPLAVISGAFPLDEEAPQANVVEAIEHVRSGRLAVAAGAADFLIVGLNAAGKIRMENEGKVFTVFVNMATGRVTGGG